MPNEDGKLAETTSTSSAERGPEQTRGLLFLSHATPEDNEFAEWLATQLVNAGYMVWCDVTKLLGGEKFWSDIEEAIQDHSFRFLFASTRHSNAKAGTLRELELAFQAAEEHCLKDFIVPLKADDLPFGEADKRINDLNFVRFDDKWSTGLAQLLKLLDRESAPRSETAGPSCVTEWINRTRDQYSKVVISNETCLSNWFTVSLPAELYIHSVSGPSSLIDHWLAELPFPAAEFENSLVTFAPAHEVHACLSPSATVDSTRALATRKLISEGDPDIHLAAFDALNIVSGLVHDAWNREMRARGLAHHELASGLKAWFFKQGQLEKNRSYYTPPGAKKSSYRLLVGNKSKRTPEGESVPDGHWHYAISASAQLSAKPIFVLRHHVIFTDDGETPWTDSNRMLRARRRVCKFWWNDKWRDLLLAMTSALEDETGQIKLSVSADGFVGLNSTPMRVVSPWTTYDKKIQRVPDEDDALLVEQLEEEDEFDDDPEALDDEV